MKLWLISQSVNNDWDTYDSAVVAAESLDEARAIHPNGYPDADWSGYEGSSWAKLSDINVELIGYAIEGTEPGVVCASFNAG